jgi:cellulose synthase/poly-beta-1,6-N-acetylglucosamine synthase-like glycosyltransferase
MLLIIITAFLLLYGLLIFYYFYFWLHAKEFSISVNSTVNISVVIAARNEESNIARLLEALEKQTYPKEFFEIIVVDDFSSDKTPEAVKPFLNDTIH